MATSIASQLQAIKSFVQGDSELLKRPFTRPSILFDPKEAADIDLDTVFSVALQGLEVLINIDERFRNYKNDLFSHKSRELDRELMGEEENKRINASIGSYLRLLSGHFQLPSSLQTLEYLIRRYKIHVYNIEELILCALPFHDTHAFVRIVQLLALGNSKWKFLDGVKVSGAPPPRKVIVQQCIRDGSVLEVLCNYASPSKNVLPSVHVISFCTAVVVEVLGSLTTVDPNVVNKILPFVKTGLQPGIKGASDHKAGALMIVGLLANKVILLPKLVKSLIRSICEVAREDAKESTDPQSLRLSLMALITLVQLQSVDIFPKKALDILKEIRELASILSELYAVFKIDKFLSLLLDSLVEYCSDDLCNNALISIIETVPVKDLVHDVVSKVLVTCIKLSHRVSGSSSSNTGNWAKKILIVVNKKYTSELHGAIRKFFEDNKVQSKKGVSLYETLCNVLDGSGDFSLPISDSKILFALHHPKAEVRRATLSKLSAVGVLKAKVDSESLVTIQDAILQQLHDDDLTVVQTALSMHGLSDILSSSDLLDALHAVLRRCVGILMLGSPVKGSLASDVAVQCLENAITYFRDLDHHIDTLAAMIFPLLLVRPKTHRLNLKALELAKEVKWPLYRNLSSVRIKETDSQPGSISSTKLEIISSLAEAFVMHLDEYTPWLIKNCKDYELSKALFLLILLQTFVIQKKRSSGFLTIFNGLFPILKAEWEAIEFVGDASIEKFKTEFTDGDCQSFLDNLFTTNGCELNVSILSCIFRRLLEAFVTAATSEVILDNKEQWVCVFQELFVFFASSQSKLVFKEHLRYLVRKFKISPVRSLSGFFTEEGIPSSVQVESLHSFAFLCSKTEDEITFQLLAEFPSLLVPLSCDDQDTRIAAMDGIEGLYSLLNHADFSSKKNGKNALWSRFLDKLLGLMVDQKRLILSDRKFLSSLLESLLSSSSHGFVVPQDISQRFDKSTKEMILAFILASALELSDHAKLRIISLLKGMGNVILHVKEVEALLSLLLERRNKYYFEHDESIQKLSLSEVTILCLLLECCVAPSSFDGHVFEDHLLQALTLNNRTPEDPAIKRPCITVLQKLNEQIYCGLKNETQGVLFHELVLLFRNADGDIQSAAREALLRINVTCSNVGHTLDCILKHESFGPAGRKKKKRLTGNEKSNLPQHAICGGEYSLSLLRSLLDILLLKKDIVNREFLLVPLFKLLGKICSDEWVNSILPLDDKLIQQSSGKSQKVSSTVCYLQQTLLLVLHDICASLRNVTSQKNEVTNPIDIKMLVECAQSSEDGVTRNHVFQVISVVAKLIPDKVLEHIHDILILIGESAVTQADTHSQRVFEDLISALVPCWLSTTDNMDKLLQIFMTVLPNVAEHRRLSIVLYLFRILGECKGLASLLKLLLQSLVSKLACSEELNAVGGFISFTQSVWEYRFAMQICERYSCMTWLPALETILRHTVGKKVSREMFTELLLATRFTLDKLQAPEFAFKLGSGENPDDIQKILEELMEQMVLVLQFVDSKSKQIDIPVTIRKEFKECIRTVLKTITRVMIPSAFFNSINNLLNCADGNVGKKALGLLCETVRAQNEVVSKRKGRRERMSARPSFQIDESSSESFDKMFMEIVKLIDASSEDSNTSLKLAAVSAVEVLALKFPSNYSIFGVCLAFLAKCVTSQNLSISSSCLRTSGALINVLGPRSLSELPRLMKNLIKVSHEVSSCLDGKTRKNDVVPVQSSPLKESFMLSVTFTLEAVIDKLGGFLNPYLVDIIELLVLHRDFVSESDLKLKVKADLVRMLLTEKIPVRLALPPLLKIYPTAVESGDSSLVVTFEMLENLVVTMDRSSVGAYHAKLFDLCLLALDLRRLHPVSVQNIEAVEKSVVGALISLTMKLTESMFKPLFVRSIEWAESPVEDVARAGSPSIDRAISFYSLVDKLAEKHRSLFVPYFKYLLDGCVRHLTDAGDAAECKGFIRKKKKARVQDNGETKEGGVLPLRNWHLRALVLSSLHKCFLYDIGSLKFLDSSNFQVLLKPIVSQLVTEPPASLVEYENVPSVNEVDDLLVVCVGQMAVTAGTDLLWKPLNHEVLMQTRSDKVRARVLGLRIVKYFVENLKEEYLVLLAETIPFLGELLEDVELSVKSLAQEIIKEMESMSGESLRQYL